jgi:hypothetical protein
MTILSWIAWTVKEKVHLANRVAETTRQESSVNLWVSVSIDE